MSRFNDFRLGYAKYSLAHLDPYNKEYAHQESKLYRIHVTFSDHCFTDTPGVRGTNQNHIFPNSSRKPGAFCFNRYGLSFFLENMIDEMIQGREKPWIVSGKSLVVRQIHHRGEHTFYGAFFYLKRVTGYKYRDMEMHITSAYNFGEGSVKTYGRVTFAKLAALTMKDMKPKPLDNSPPLRLILPTT